LSYLLKDVLFPLTYTGTTANSYGWGNPSSADFNGDGKMDFFVCGALEVPPGQIPDYLFT